MSVDIRSQINVLISGSLCAMGAFVILRISHEVLDKELEKTLCRLFAIIEQLIIFLSDRQAIAGGQELFFEGFLDNELKLSFGRNVGPEVLPVESRHEVGR
jgi:hypothetical protein